MNPKMELLWSLWVTPKPKIKAKKPEVPEA